MKKIGIAKRLAFNIQIGIIQVNCNRLSALLESASAGTEERFLLLGSRLADFHRRSRDVTRQVETISQLLIDADTVQGVPGLKTLVASLVRRRNHIDASSPAQALSGWTAGFAAKISEIVAALQFQDIVRQKIMHVQQALADVESARLAPAEKAEIFSLQTAQLQDARNDLEAAVNRMLLNMLCLAAQLGATAEQTRKVAVTTLLGEVEQVTGGSLTLLRAFKSIKRWQLDQLAALDSMTASLAADLLAVAENIDVHVVFSRDIDRVIKELQLFAPPGLSGQRGESALFRELMERYTMHSERRIHQRQQHAADENEAIPRRRDRIEHDLGDNVELF